ncbi:MAG: glycosyltransferase [Candidatus Dadabacteria bacterium]|nr:glycosyltransferase [Candidatus Dadabacteria bacterium]
MKGKLLVCAYYFPPIGTPRSYRWREFVTHLSQKGWAIDILTINTNSKHSNYDSKLMDNLPNELSVFRTYPGIMHHFSNLLLSKTRDNPEFSSLNARTSFRQKLWKSLFKIFEKKLRTVFIPDEAVSWLPFALMKGNKLVKEGSYDVIISSGFPFTCHIVGFFLKRFSGGKPWIADYGDPWVYNPSFPLPEWRSSIDKKIESKILRDANRLIFTTDKTKEHYLNLYPFLKSENINVITQGFSHKEFSESIPERTDKFRIVYTGSFYKDEEPFIFFDALKHIGQISKDIEVIIVGNMPNDEYKRYADNRGLAEIVRFIGFVPNKRAISLQKGASVLLLIGHSGGIQVPGKTYEYIAARRPILSIKMDSADIASLIVDRFKRGISVENDPLKISQVIIDLYNSWKSNRLESEFNLEDIDEFRWDKLADNLERAILEVAGA